MRAACDTHILHCTVLYKEKGDRKSEEKKKEEKKWEVSWGNDWMSHDWCRSERALRPRGGWRGSERSTQSGREERLGTRIAFLREIAGDGSTLRGLLEDIGNGKIKY